MLPTILLTLHVIIALLIITLVLMQKNNSRMLAMGGASQTLFGSQGSKSFMTRLTGAMVMLLFATSLVFRLVTSQETTDELLSLSTRPQDASVSDQNK